MSEHAWAIEEVDGGHLGVNDCWHCPVCGVGGGPAFHPYERRTFKPFIPGPAKQVSEDCETAQQEIRAYAEERIGVLRAKWKAETGEHRHYASLFHDALRWNPKITNIVGVLRLIQRVEDPVSTGHRDRPSLMDCRHALEKAGFDMSGGALGQAVLALGNDRLARLRAGEVDDDD